MIAPATTKPMSGLSDRRHKRPCSRSRPTRPRRCRPRPAPARPGRRSAHATTRTAARGTRWRGSTRSRRQRRRSASSVTPPVGVERPVPMVAATAVEANAPAKFMSAAISTAIRGESARVETEVATAFAVSWKPFVKSKASADDDTDEQHQRKRSSSVLQVDALENVGGALAAVDGLLEILVDVLPADHHQRVEPSGRAAPSPRARAGRPRPRACARRSGAGRVLQPVEPARRRRRACEPRGRSRRPGRSPRAAPPRRRRG